MTGFPAHLRSAATLVALVVILLVGVTWAWSAVTDPFPEREEVTTCDAKQVAKGDKIYPDQVTVSVLNAGTREGLADRTMTDLVANGLARGEVGNAPDETDVTGVQVWAEDKDNPAVKLVLSFLGKDAKIVSHESSLPGVNVVVGDDFPGAVKGRGSIKAREDATFCSPGEEDLDDL